MARFGNRSEQNQNLGRLVYMIDRGRGKHMLLLLVLLLVTVLYGIAQAMDAAPRPELIRVPVTVAARRRPR